MIKQHVPLDNIASEHLLEKPFLVAEGGIEARWDFWRRISLSP
ncbi:hypothetical protein [Pseudomonas coronafaciens]|nr:hypothetical protein [Pseudomonas coronafaciens]